MQQYCIKRLSSGLRFSPSLALLKRKLESYCPSLLTKYEARLKQLGRNSEKSFEAIASIASYLSCYLFRIHCFTYPECGKQICSYLRENLQDEIHKRFFKPNQRNPEELFLIGKRLILKDISNLESILSIHPDDQGKVHDMVWKYYYNNSPSKKKFCEKVANILCLERKLNASEFEVRQQGNGKPFNSSNFPQPCQQQNQLTQPILDIQLQVPQKLQIIDFSAVINIDMDSFFINNDMKEKQSALSLLNDDDKMCDESQQQEQDIFLKQRMNFSAHQPQPEIFQRNVEDNFIFQMITKGDVFQDIT